MRPPQIRGERTIEVPMTPMIDVVFLLLIFFVWTSSFQIPELDLPSAIAESATPLGSLATDVSQPPESFEEIVVTIAESDGGGFQIEFNQQKIADIAALRTRMAGVVALGVQPPVIVDPAPNVPMQMAVGVFDALRLAGADRVLFAIGSAE